MTMTTTEVEQQEFVDLSISEIQDDPQNLRQEYDGIEDLADSIKSQGLMQPIIVRRDDEGKYIIKAGHRRKRALILAGFQRTRAIVDHRAALPENVIATMLIENGHRKDLNAMEQAFGLAIIEKRLEFKNGKKPTATEIGEFIGRTQVWVSDRLALLSLNPEQQAAVREGRTTIGEAVRLGRLNKGTNRPQSQGKKSGGYFTSHHDLGDKAAKRCRALGHKSGGPNYVAVACGKCWEHVIRTDERDKVRTDAFKNGHCTSCNQPVDTTEGE